MMHFCTAAPDVAALALSGDWAAEFLSGPESASAPGLASLSDAADADWTREFIAEAAGSPRRARPPASLEAAFAGFIRVRKHESKRPSGRWIYSLPTCLFVPDPGRWAEEYLEQSEEKLWLGDLGDKEHEWLEHRHQKL